MKPSEARTLIAIVATLAVAAATWWWWSDRSPDGAGPNNTPTQSEAGPATPRTLYFPDDHGTLSPEVRQVPTASTDEGAAQAVVEELLGGPTGEGLFSPLPQGTTLSGVMVSGTGVAYVDLQPGESGALPSGSQRELLAAYSLVNTVCENVPSVRRVVLLWNGEQKDTFAGNLDTRRPLSPRRELIRAQ